MSVVAVHPTSCVAGCPFHTMQGSAYIVMTCNVRMLIQVGSFFADAETFNRPDVWGFIAQKHRYAITALNKHGVSSVAPFTAEAGWPAYHYRMLRTCCANGRTPAYTRRCLPVQDAGSGLLGTIEDFMWFKLSLVRPAPQDRQDGPSTSGYFSGHCHTLTSSRCCDGENGI